MPDQPADPRRRHKLGPFSTWQWAVIGSYIVAIILSFIVGRTSNAALDNTERLDLYACYQITYLESQAIASANPVSRSNLRNFAANLRNFAACPPPDPRLGG